MTIFQKYRQVVCQSTFIPNWGQAIGTVSLTMLAFAGICHKQMSPGRISAVLLVGLGGVLLANVGLTAREGARRTDGNRAVELECRIYDHFVSVCIAASMIIAGAVIAVL